MSATLGDIRALLEKKIRSVPLIPAASLAWKQSGWTLSCDGSLRALDEPLVSVSLFEFWTKIIQQRNNGFDGESFYIRVVFDHTKKADEIAAHLGNEFRKTIELRITSLIHEQPQIRT
jgi:Iap family predicted aminopeptidase